MAKIESLTPEQWAEVHQHRDQVIERCLNQPLDHNKIGQAIGACYEAVGGEAPLATVWGPRPGAGQIKHRHAPRRTDGTGERRTKQQKQRNFPFVP